jgi:hypothetical protein
MYVFDDSTSPSWKSRLPDGGLQGTHATDA